MENDIPMKEFQALLTRVDVTGKNDSIPQSVTTDSADKKSPAFQKYQLQLSLPDKPLIIRVSDANQEYLKQVYFDLITYCTDHRESPFKFVFSSQENGEDSIGVQTICSEYIDILNEEIKQIFKDFESLKTSEE
jgi:hypothetical protein